MTRGFVPDAPTPVPQLSHRWFGEGEIKKGFAASVVRAGLDNITPHDIRRSAARHMIERGVSMEEVSQLLGHKSVEVTARVYARFSSTFLQTAVNVL